MPPVIAAGVGLAIPAIAGTTTASVIGSGAFAAGLFGAEKLLGDSKSKSQQKGPHIDKVEAAVSFEPEIVAISSRFYSYGRNRVGGAFAFRESDGRTLGYGLVLNCWPIDGIDTYYVDDEALTLATGPVIHQYQNSLGLYGVATYDEGEGVYWPPDGLKRTAFIGYFWLPNYGTVAYTLGYGPAGFLEFRNATDAGFSSRLLRNYFPSLWTTDHKCQGLAMLYSRWQSFAMDSRAAHYPRLYPIHSTVVRGAKVFDPRDNTQTFLSGGVYTRYNPTWKFSANPALMIADFLTFPDGFGLAYEDLDWTSFIKAANDCDRVVGTFGGGFEPFARAHFTWTADMERREILTQLQAACDGQLYEDGNGRVVLWVGQHEDVDLTFTDADIAAVQIEELSSVYGETNLVQGTYVEPRLNYAKNSAPYAVDDAAIAVVGERKTNVDFGAVQSFNQAYRLEWRALRRSNPVRKFTVSGGPRLLLADGRRFVSLSLDRAGVTATVRVVSMQVQDLANITLELHQLADDAWDDVVAPSDPINASLPGVVVVSSVIPPMPTITSTSSSVASTQGSLTVTVAVPTDASLTTRFQIRRVNPTTHVPIGSGDWQVVSDYTGQYTGLQEGIVGVVGTPQTYEVQAWFVTTLDQPGPLSASAFVDLNF